MLEDNGYPRLEINKWLNEPEKVLNTVEEISMVTASIPYVCGLSKSIHCILCRLDICTVYTSRKWKWQLMCHVKDRVDRSQDPGVIYKISCNDCSKVYIGETGRTAKVRVSEHEANARNGHPERSAVAAHAEGHEIKWQAEVLIERKSGLFA